MRVLFAFVCVRALFGEIDVQTLNESRGAQILRIHRINYIFVQSTDESKRHPLSSLFEFDQIALSLLLSHEMDLWLQVRILPPPV